MARPRAELPEAADLRALADSAGRLGVRVTPGARSEGLEIADGRVMAKVRAKPEDGKATEAVRQLIASALGAPSSSVTLLRGATSRDKLFQI